ncbi:PEX5-related protein isoform X1 [Electrophorus electricus]|uniref:PEX5-related protein isoform X1 n=2 Tax=Electrophorus electricus TaxID=8005 RepID=UPI0015D09F0C|nr:PEX5-related protein isoform X1 [Electrophorus electricus]
MNSRRPSYCNLKFGTVAFGLGKDSGVVAMVLKELPSKASSDGNPLLTVTTKLGCKHQESRPLLSPSIDDFQSMSKSDGATRPVTSNTAVLSTSLDLVDLSEPCERRWTWDRRTPCGSRRDGSFRGSLRRRMTDETELIPLEAEPLSPGLLNPESVSLDSASTSPLEKQEEMTLHMDSASIRRRRQRSEKRCTSLHSNSKLLWSADFKNSPFNKHGLEQSPSTESDPEPTSQQQKQSLGSSLLGMQHSLEEEFLRAKAAVESDTEFWDKMQEELEELARRNWLEDMEGDNLASLTETGYYFHTENPYKDCPNAFKEAVQKSKEGNLNTAVLLLEAAILQDPLDSEAWQMLGTTQAENENEQAAIVCLKRCLELHPNNLRALMALAVSLTNTGQRQDACEALHCWIRHNPIYRHLLRDRSPLDGSPLPKHKCSTASPISSLRCSQLVEVLELYQEAVQQNPCSVDPDLQTGLGVLFNLSSDFDKAVEAFSTALTVRPEDYLLWNRLGATLANGDRSVEAVEAYTRALELQPGFIRSRYNLGISCINLGAHREAVNNFLTALKLQRKNKNHLVMSSSIWAALRIAVSFMDVPELFQAATVGDLEFLMKAFNMDM